MMAEAWLPCSRCGHVDLPGARLCTCAGWKSPATRRLMERMVEERHRAAVRKATSRAVTVGKAA